ncbi:MAG: SRPBCC family protein [Myxococcales bacterium]|nr:MAG: SRPBCC family protein [Myxococcales bacterium]
MASFSDFTTYAQQTGARLSEQPLVFEITRHFDVSRQELFNYVSDIDKLGEWIWFAKASWADNSDAEVPGQVGAVRVIQSRAGPPVREVVKAYEAPRMLAYSAEDAAFMGMCTDHLGVLTCEPHPDGGTVVCWQAYGKLASNPAKAWGGKKLFQVALSNGMKNLERKLTNR